MPRAADPTQALREAARTLPDVVEGTSCNQTSFKAGKAAFLYVGPGAKGVGFKAMFKLERSLPKAEELASKNPDRVEVGANGWVTARFSAERPLAKSAWDKWLRESYALATGGAPAKKAPARKKAEKATRKR